MTESREDLALARDGRASGFSSAKHPTPARLLAITALSVFVGEFIVMLILAAFPGMPIALEALVDGLMITTLATPVLLLFLFRPMVHQIEQREAAERELKILNDELEVRVGERTRELSSSNEQLRREIEDRRTAEIGLSKSSEFIHRVLEAAPCVLAIYDVNSTQCTFVNERVSELLGYSPDDVVVKGSAFFEEVFSTEDLTRFRELNGRIAAGIEEGITVCECRLRAVGDEPRSFSLGFIPMEGTGASKTKDVLLAAVPTGTGWPDDADSPGDERV